MKTKTISKKDLFIIRFTADWCYPCKIMDKEWNKKQIQDQLLKEYKNQSINPIIYNIDIDKDKVKLFNVQKIPSIFIIDDDGNIYKEEIGIINLDEFLKNPFTNQDKSPIKKLNILHISKKPAFIHD